MSERGTGLTILGKLLTVMMVLALFGLGYYLMTSGGNAKAPPSDDSPAPGLTDAQSDDGSAATPQSPSQTGTGSAARTPVAPAELQTEVPALAPAAPYQPQGDTIEVELSEYAGYAGLIVANGGLEPNENSVFFQRHGFKVRLTLSEEESWSRLNSGGMAASATTADVLAVYGKQFNVTVPALIGFSRGADGIVVRSDINRINQLRGKTLSTGQFTEAEFFMRYLAQEAGLEVFALESPDATPHPDRVNLVFADDASTAADMFLEDLQSGRNRLAGTIAWAPKTTEVAEASNGQAKVLITNTNLLIIADILIVNKGFAEQHPEMVRGLVDGLLDGNRQVRDNPTAHIDTIARGFGWERDEVLDELKKVHLANLPENLAFFTGAIDAAGSFGGIYQSAVYAYGRDLIPDPPPSERFVNLDHLRAIEQTGRYGDQQIAIAPIRTTATPTIEEDPLLSKDIRFHFLPNSADLDMSSTYNLENLGAMRELLQVSPGSILLLKGHVDDARKQEFEQIGGSMLRTMTLKAVELSQNRADAVERALVERHKVDPNRVETVGRGWDEPIGTDPDPGKRMEQNRRVEVQWFTVE